MNPINTDPRFRRCVDSATRPCTPIRYRHLGQCPRSTPAPRDEPQDLAGGDTVYLEGMVPTLKTKSALRQWWLAQSPTDRATGLQRSELDGVRIVQTDGDR